MAIITAVPNRERAKRPDPAPAIPAPTADPMRGTIDAIDRLVQVIEAQRQQPATPSAFGDMPPMPPEPRPTRLEAEITRDKAGKMQRVIITPVY